MTTQHSGRAVSDYVARNEKEITLRNGQAIEIKSIRGQWWLVRTLSGNTGYVPSHCVESYEAPGIPVSAPSRYPDDTYSVRESVRDHPDDGRRRQDNPRRVLRSRRVIRDSEMYQSGLNPQMQSEIQGQQWTYAVPQQENPYLKYQSLRMPPFSGNSGFGTPIPGAPGFGTPPLGVPGFYPANYNTPTLGPPGYGTQTLGYPGFGGPTLGTPGFGGSTFGTPGFGGSIVGTPGFGGSTLGTPGFGYGAQTVGQPGFNFGTKRY